MRLGPVLDIATTICTIEYNDPAISRARCVSTALLLYILADIAHTHKSREPSMTQSKVVRYVSGDWNPARSLVRLRLEAEPAGEHQDFLIAPRDVQPLVVLLLMLSGKVGAEPPREPEDDSQQMVPLHLTSVGLGQTEDGEIVLQLHVGATALAFILSPGMTRALGQALMTLSAPSPRAPAN